MPRGARRQRAQWHIAGRDIAPPDRDQSALLRHLREHARLSASVGRTQARLCRRLRDTGETERVGGGASRPSRVWRTERRVVGPGSAERVRQDTAGPHAGIPSTAQPSRSRPVATQPLLQRRPAAVERLAIEPLQRHIRAEMRDHRAQATDRGQSPTCGCGADDPLKLQPPSSGRRFSGSPSSSR
jgi:hypothetical protein